MHKYADWKTGTSRCQRSNLQIHNFFSKKIEKKNINFFMTKLFFQKSNFCRFLQILTLGRRRLHLQKFSACGGQNHCFLLFWSIVDLTFSCVSRWRPVKSMTAVLIRIQLAGQRHHSQWSSQRAINVRSADSGSVWAAAATDRAEWVIYNAL